MHTYIQQSFDDGIQLRQQCTQQLETPLLQAAQLIADSLKAGSKILICGNGGSASDAQHFVGELVNRFEIDRPGLAAIALVNDAAVMTSIGNDIAFEQVFSRQVEALGKPGDLLLALSTSGDSANVIAAAKAAHRSEMGVITLTGRDGGALGRINAKIHLNIPSNATPRIQEMHITCLHILCGLIDKILFGGKSNR